MDKRNTEDRRSSSDRRETTERRKSQIEIGFEDRRTNSRRESVRRTVPDRRQDD